VYSNDRILINKYYQNIIKENNIKLDNFYKTYKKAECVFDETNYYIKKDIIYNIMVIHRIDDNIVINSNQNMSCNYDNYNIFYKIEYDYCKEFISTSKQLNTKNRINKCYINNQNDTTYNVETFENMTYKENQIKTENMFLTISKYIFYIYILLQIITQIKIKINEINKPILINKLLPPNTECIISYNIIKSNTYYYKCERCVAVYEWDSYIEYINTYRKYKCAYCTKEFNLKKTYINTCEYLI
jgi:hypothetical protein